MSERPPLVSFLIEAGDQGRAADRSLASLRALASPDWEAIVASDPPAAPGGDARIRYVTTTRGAGLQQLFDEAAGEYVIVLAAGDTVLRDAITAVADAASGGAACVYADTDRIVSESRRARNHRPDWSPERLRHGDYLTRFCALDTKLAREAGGFRREFEGAEYYDLVLRVTERCAPDEIVHHPEVVVHADGDVNHAGVVPLTARAAQEQYDRLAIDAVVTAASDHHRVLRRAPTTTSVSLIIPTMGTSGVVFGTQRCFVIETVRSALARTSLTNVEVVVVYDPPTPPEVLDQLREIAGPRLVLVPYTRPFSFSEKCNVGSLHASGDVLVLLNDDTEAISEGWLETLIAPLAEPDVGMTGACLLFEDGTVQHAGHLFITRQDRPMPSEAYRGATFDQPTELHSLQVNRETSGTTAACAAMRREVWDEVGGLCEDLPVNYNDVDLCMKVRSTGRRIVWLAGSRLYHFESKTRARGVNQWEWEVLGRRWAGSVVEHYMPWLVQDRDRPDARALSVRAAVRKPAVDGSSATGALR